LEYIIRRGERVDEKRRFKEVGEKEELDENRIAMSIEESM
jgi:hypothetical protein